MLYGVATCLQYESFRLSENVSAVVPRRRGEMSEVSGFATDTVLRVESTVLVPVARGEALSDQC